MKNALSKIEKLLTCFFQVHDHNGALAEGWEANSQWNESLGLFSGIYSRSNNLS